MGDSYEPMIYEDPRGEKRPGQDIERLQDEDTAIMADNDDLEMGYVGFLKDARSEQNDHKLITDNLINGHLLVVTEGVQVKDKPDKQ